MHGKPPDQEGYLCGHMLIAMPTLLDPRFQRTVIYVCAHSAQGAMGIIVNRIFSSVTFRELLGQLGIPSHQDTDRQVYFGGPVESGRGFVLHSTDRMQEDSLKVDDSVALTGTLDILRSIAQGQGPHDSLFALGYAGWDAGQLDAEIQDNGWLSMPADYELLFDTALEDKWERALGLLGINPLMLSVQAGHA